MLGLRINPLRKRSGNSIADLLHQESGSDLDMPATDAHQATQQHTFAAHGKAPDAVNVAVNELQNSDSDSVEGGRRTVSRTVSQTKTQTVSSSTRITRVIEISRTIKRRIVREIDDVHEDYFEGLSLDTYLDFIAEERLLHMPPRGSQWDKVLKAAEFFGLQIYSFGDKLSNFVLDSRSASCVALASCRLLLEVGHSQSQALEPTFNTLFDLAFLISQACRSYQHFDATESIRECLGDLHYYLVDLVGSIAIHYRKRISVMNTNNAKSTTIDFDGAFGKSIDQLWGTKAKLAKLIWGFQLRHKHYPMSFDTVLYKLQPLEPSVRTLLYTRLADKSERVEGTCEWIQSHLLDFLRSDDRLLTISGKPGCGKSMLGGWMKERLQRPLGRTSYETFSYTFASDAPGELNTLAFLKSLLDQLLQRNVGDTHFYEKLIEAFGSQSENQDPKGLETALWLALKAGLETVNREKAHLVIVIDGVDELHDKHTRTELHKRLHECIEHFARVRVINLSEHELSLHKGDCRNLSIKKEMTRDDMVLYFRQSLPSNPHYKEFNRDAQQKFIDKLVDKAHGSFLWAKLVVASLAKETSCQHLTKAADSFHSGLDSLVENIVSKIDMHNNVTRHLLAFMLVAQRPLTVNEMTDLLEIDLEQRTLTKGLDLRKHISKSCANLVVIRNGLVRFGHSVIRKHLRAQCGKHLMTLKEAHSEFTLRILFYSRRCIHSPQEPSFDGISGDALQEIFRTHFLAEYVVRHWVLHFKVSSFCGSKGELCLPGHFHELFPDSATFAMLEWSCWQTQTTHSHVIELHDISLRIRTACFGEKHHSVMQTLIIVGSLHRSSSNLVKAAEFFYRASCIGQTILYKFSTTVVTCTSLFLTCTETITITKRTEIVTYREEMIRFMIEICKCKHGNSSDAVIHWYKVLARLYIEIKEEHRSTLVYKELYELMVIRFGKGSAEVREVSKTLTGLEIVLRGGESQKEIIEYNEWVFEASDELEITDELRISIIIRLARSYEASGQWFLAEKLFINLWCRISEICRLRATIELHMIKIRVALEYVMFLHRIKRVEEATNILICLWAEYEHSSFESELIIIRIKEIGILFRSFGLLSVAISVFAKVWGWFKSKGKIEHEEARSTTILITEVVEEITETTTTTKTTTKTVTTTTETIVKEVFETTYTRCQHGKIDSHFFKSCMALISLYILQEKWSEAEIVIRRSLEITWKAVLSVETKLTITGTYISECVLIATQLAICYHRQRHFEKAEEIYLRIYHACLISVHIEHECMTSISLALIRFYEEYHRHDRVIEIYIELLGHYRKHLGATHRLTIRTLYALGSVCVLLGRKEAYSYYLEIVTILNKGHHCHHDAFEAAVILLHYYHREEKWTELRQICVVLWETFKHHYHEHVFTVELIQTIYEKYTYVLEYHAKVEFSVLYKLTVEYRETVTKVFGITAAIVLTAMIALARICEKHEEHYHESVTIYEEVIKKITTTTTVTTVETETITKTVKKRLSKMYVTIITTGSSTTVTTIERAIAICIELYEQYKIEYGCWHETTLLQLRDLVILYKKIDNHESHKCIKHLLQVSVVEIITTVTTSMGLFTAAKTLASIFVSVGMIGHGHEILHQLHHLIILRDLGSSEHVTIRLDGKVDKSAFVFLVAFHSCLEQKITLSYTEIMVDILTETFLYEQYSKTIREEASIEIFLEHGAKLRSFWEVRKRTSLVAFLDKKLFESFKMKYSAYIKVSDQISHIFYLVLLGELAKDRAKLDFGTVVCWSTNAKVKALLEAGEFRQAHDFAKCAFDFIGPQRLYHSHHTITCGYKLAEYMAGVDVRRTTDHKLRESMLETSRVIMRDVLVAFRESKISFVSLKFEDLAGLIRLLGEQQNYGELQNLLEQLWQSREVQKTWSSVTVLSIGRCLIHAYYGNGHPSKAIELCDTICYNLRRSRGWLDRDALAMTELLTQLYTSMHRHADVMRLHEEVLREIDENDDDRHVDTADHHFKLLRAAFHRLGHWDKNERTYRDLYKRLQRYKGLKTTPIEKWAHHGDEAHGQYSLPKEWRIVPGTVQPIAHDQDKRSSIRRAASGRWYGLGGSTHSLSSKHDLMVSE